VAKIRVGIGGWSFAPWRDNFYPRGLKQADELAFASQHVSTIEVNGTFYRTQSPESFRRWAEETPKDFVFSIKAHRLTTHRKVLAESAPAISRFLESGLLELGKKLGPILWQFAPTKKFEAEDFEAFLGSLPPKMDSHKFRHVVEVRHESFCNADFVALARRYKVAICLALSDKYPLIADPTADFIYARLQTSQSKEANGYSKKELDRWAGYAKAWAEAKAVEELALLAKPAAGKAKCLDCFIYFIAGAKERNPAAAMALMERLK
jgi:uncharacterized protein YecE (DUF72 family)